MTKLLEQAIEKIRQLPESDQDEAAELLFGLIAKREEPLKLDDATRQAIHRGLEEVRDGKLATDEQVAAVFNRYR